MESHPFPHTTTHYSAANGHGINYHGLPSEYAINQGSLYIS